MNIFEPKISNRVLCNPGCGILYLQRGMNKTRYEDVAKDSWFLRERLTDKIAFSIHWSVIEPEEGHFLWEHPDWEGCIDSWIKAGFKVALQVRGMDTLGTLYNEGVPQWVFDAGAKFIDEPIQNYQGTFLLNSIPGNAKLPVRYPVYWDPIYLEKVEQLVSAMGKRYDGRPEIEYVGIGHMGRWGEMHVADHGPLKPWLDAGLSLEAFIQAHLQIIDIYLKAFPNTQLSQEIGAPAFGEGDAPDLFSIEDAEPVYSRLAEKGIHIKFNGLGKSWRKGGSPYLDESVEKLMLRYSGRTKVCFENLVLPKALQEGLACGMSYWHRGGESQGLGILKVEEQIPIQEKRIYSFHKFFSKEYAALSIEDEKSLWRMMARRCGYRLELQELCAPETLSPGQSFATELRWLNSGCASCHEKFLVKLALRDADGRIAWTQSQEPGVACSPDVWRSGATVRDSLNWLLPQDAPAGDFDLLIGLQLASRSGQMLQLPIEGEADGGLFKAARLSVRPHPYGKTANSIFEPAFQRDSQLTQMEV